MLWSVLIDDNVNLTLLHDRTQYKITIDCTNISNVIIPTFINETKKSNTNYNTPNVYYSKNINRCITSHVDEIADHVMEEFKANHDPYHITIYKNMNNPDAHIYKLAITGILQDKPTYYFATSYDTFKYIANELTPGINETYKYDNVILDHNTSLNNLSLPRNVGVIDIIYTRIE